MFIKLQNEQVTYRKIRRAIGCITFLLPLTLIYFSFIPYFNTNLQTSISQYYYTNLREIFTGSFIATAVFLYLYKGKPLKTPEEYLKRQEYQKGFILKNEEVMSTIAAIFAIGIAIFPPPSINNHLYGHALIKVDHNAINYLHHIMMDGYIFCNATILFFCFTIGQIGNENKKNIQFNENTLYYFSGLALLVLMIINHFSLFPYSYLVLSTIIFSITGINWMIKGRAFGDSGKLGMILYNEQNYVSSEF